MPLPLVMLRSGYVRMCGLKKNLPAGWMCALATLCCILLIHPRAEMGISDDWSFFYIAKNLAETGHIHYDGWAEPILGPQLYLGALFIKLLGSSFTAVRASTMLVSVLAVPILHALLMRCGVRRNNATLGTLTIVASPLYLPLATTYMSDNFALFFLLLFFYACVRCVDTEEGEVARWWLVGAVAAGLAAGSVRQVAWLSVLLALPCLAWQQRQRRAVVVAGAISCLASLGVILLVTLWFHRQPYAAIGMIPPAPGTIFDRIAMAVRGIVTLFLLLLPVLFGIALSFLARKRRDNLLHALAWLMMLILVAAVTYANGGAWWGHWLLGNLSTGGVMMRFEMLGPRPEVIPGWLQVAAVLVTLTTAIAGAGAFWSFRRVQHEALGAKRDAGWTMLLLPFGCTYLVLVFSRPLIFDRYFLPLLPLAVLAMLRWYERRFASDMSRWCLAPLAMLAIYGVGGTHDLFTATNARLAAADELRGAGIRRTDVQGGYEYDMWTQLEFTSGHIPKVAPAGVYGNSEMPSGLAEEQPSNAYAWQKQTPPWNRCYRWFRRYTPSIHAQYVLEGAPAYCFAPSHFAPVFYQTWLPPFGGGIYIAEVPERFR